MTGLIQSGHWNAARKEQRLPAHRNPGLELVWVANGEVTWDYGGRPVHVSPGQVSFSWPWQTHGAYRERVALVEVYWLILPLESGMRRVRHPRLDSRLGPLAAAVNQNGFLEKLRTRDVPVLMARPPIRKAFKEAVHCLDRGQGNPGLHGWGWLSLVFAELEAAWNPDEDSLRSQDQETVRRFLKEVKSRLDEPWTLESLASACGMGRTRFAAAVKQVSGDTPLRTLNRLRVEQGLEAVRRGEGTISEIAYRHGFGSSQYFATVCKRMTGKNPGHFRR